ncbi:MAG: hypothetical protein ACXWEY_01115 [Bacteroidia bacterium]
MKNTDQHTKIAEGRQTFIKSMFILAAGALAGKWFSKSSKPANTAAATGEKIKMLTADGKLVEVDRAFIKHGQKASGDEIKTWLNRKI